MLSVGLSICALFFSILTFCFTYRNKKIRQTISAYRELQDYSYFFYEYDKNEIEDFVTDPATKEYKTVSTCIAEIEIFAAGVKENIYNFNLVYKLAHGYLDGTLKSRIFHILEIKNYEGTNKYYKNTLWLLYKMERKASIASKKVKI